MVAIIYLRRPSPGGSSDSTRKVPRAASSLPYSVLLRVGFTKPPDYSDAGALLPHLSTLTFAPRTQAVAVSMALSRRLPSPDVIRHTALWSPDFPLKAHTSSSDCLSCSEERLELSRNAPSRLTRSRKNPSPCRPRQSRPFPRSLRRAAPPRFPPPAAPSHNGRRLSHEYQEPPRVGRHGSGRRR